MKYSHSCTSQILLSLECASAISAGLVRLVPPEQIYNQISHAEMNSFYLLYAASFPPENSAIGETVVHNHSPLEIADQKEQ